jgi:hypothetical protein
MAAQTNMTTTLNSVGNREDLEDVIYRVAAEKTPVFSMIDRKKATARFHEWQIESLATPVTSNAQLEGDDVTALDTANLTTRVGNYCQIFRKTLAVSRSQEVVDKAGRKSEVNRQKVLKGIELRRDVEKTICANLASVNESGATPRSTAGFLAWLTSNVSRGASGASGGFSAGIVAAATNGTQRAFTEALMKAAWATAFNNGADPSVAFMGGVLKQEFSAFTGIADIRTEVKNRNQATITGAADIYVGDFGSVSAVPHPYAFTRDFLAVDPEYAAVAVLDGFKTDDLNKTGDTAAKKIMTFEAAFECANEKAHFVVADLQ